MPQEVLDSLSIETRSARWSQILSNPDPGDETWVYEKSGDILGWCSIGPNRDELGDKVGELWAIYVLPEAQGNGIGSALIEKACSALRGKGYASAILWTLTENAAARAFYEAKGWSYDGVTQLEPTGAIELNHSRYSRAL